VIRGLQRQGVNVHVSTPCESVKSGKDSVTFTAAGEEIEVDWLVLAAGRGPDVAGLGLEEAKIKLTERGLIEVDGAQRTSREASTRSAI